MIVVSGTKRSGTSMWMQVLSAAGLPVFGQAFPRSWGESALRDANPDGFYESTLRDGIYFATNPHPRTGVYFTPAEAEGFAVKVFGPGVVRSERGYLECVIANVRPWQEYEASVGRLWALDDAARKQKAPGATEPFRFPAAIEWWTDNFGLIRDAFRRRYPIFLQGYAQVLADPQTYVGRVFETIGRGDVNAAIAAVKAENRTQNRTHSDSLEPWLAAAFDELYAFIESGKAIDEAFVGRLEEVHAALLPTLFALQKDLAKSMWRSGARPPMPPIPGLPH